MSEPKKEKPTIESVKKLEPSQEELDLWLSQEEIRRDEAREKAIEEKGLLPYLELVSGKITRFKILRQKPEQRLSSFKKMQYVIKVIHKDILKDWTVTINSPFAGYVLDKLSKAPIDVAVMTTGKDKDTRYEFIEDDEDE